jgi:hypothetical protein
LLNLLDGLPVALVAVARYMNDTGMSLATFIRLYCERWTELMQACGRSITYPLDSLFTSWSSCYTAVRAKNPATANLLLLWSHLHNGSLWHDLLASVKRKPIAVQQTYLFGNIIHDELQFADAMRILRQHSLVEAFQGEQGGKIHPVVHRWLRSIQSPMLRTNLALFALMIVSSWVEMRRTQSSREIQDCLRYHADECVGRRDLLSLYYVDRRVENDDSGYFWAPLQSFYTLRKIYYGADQVEKARYIEDEAYRLYMSVRK